jgi:hypothetical protein
MIGAILLLSFAGSAAASAAPHPVDKPDTLLSQARETVYIDNKCRRTAQGWNQVLLPPNSWRVAHVSPFEARGQNYWLVFGKFQDGSSLLCVTRPGYMNGRKLAIPTLQSQFIGDIKKESKASFQIIVNGGNGRLVDLTSYRIDLSNPDNPLWSVLSRWRGQPVSNPIMR